MYVCFFWQSVLFLPIVFYITADGGIEDKSVIFGAKDNPAEYPCKGASHEVTSGEKKVLTILFEVEIFILSFSIKKLQAGKFVRPDSSRYTLLI